MGLAAGCGAASAVGPLPKATKATVVVDPPQSGAVLAARHVAVEESWWLWQGGAGSRLSAKRRPSSSLGERPASAVPNLRPGSYD